MGPSAPSTVLDLVLCGHCTRPVPPGKGAQPLNHIASTPGVRQEQFPRFFAPSAVLTGSRAKAQRQ